MSTSSKTTRHNITGSLKIKKFLLSQIANNSTIVMIAKRNSGKSWVVRAILHHFKEVPVCVVISPTDKNTSYYSKFLPDSYIYYKYESKIIQNILTRQDEIIKKNKVRATQNKKLVDERAILVMDDCMADDKEWKKDKLIKEVLCNGRHSQLMFMMTMQYPLGMNPQQRSNLDYVFLLKETKMSNIKKIYENYASVFPYFEMFTNAFQELTKDHGCMVLVNRGDADTLSESVFYYKAPDLRLNTDTIGCSQYREYHTQNYNPDFGKHAEKFDINAWRHKSKNERCQLIVQKE